MNIRDDLPIEEIRRQSLQVDIKDKLLTISIGEDVLAYAIEMWMEEYKYRVHSFNVTDPSLFMKEIRNALLDEDEVGATMVHALFEKATDMVLESSDASVDVKYE